MLKNLMKYDLKKMLKLLIWYYAVAIVLAGLSRLFSIWNHIQIIGIITSVLNGCIISAIFTILINTFIHIPARFKSSFYNDQAYLTHTLPVKKEKLLLSKYLSGLIVIFLSVFCCILTVFIAFYSKQNLMTLVESIQLAVSGFNISNWLIILLLVLIIFTQICSLMSMIYTAIVKGQSNNYRRGIKSGLWFVLFYDCVTLLTVLFAFIITLFLGNGFDLFSEKMSQSTFLIVLLVALFTNIVSSIFFYFFCEKEFKKGVNID